MIKNCRSLINNPSGQIGHLIIFLALIPICLLIGKFITLESPLLVLGLICGIVVIFITLINTNLALIVLIFSMLLSPEIPIAQVPERAVVVRIDDILLLFIFFTWFAKAAINKELGLLRNTPLNRPMIIYTVLCVAVTTIAIFLGIGRAKFAPAFFYILKYTEYLMLFFMVANNLKSVRESKFFTVFLLLTCFLVCIYGYVQIQQGAYRVTAPFEGKKSAEPNTLAGYLIIILSLCGGLFLHSKSFKQKIILGALFLFIIPVFLFTLSRGGYMGFFAMYLTFIAFSKKNRLFLVSLFLILMIILPFILPVEVVTRITTTFTGKAKYKVLGKRMNLEESAAARIETWEYILNVFAKSPLFGYGVTGIYFVDTQYGRVLGESGITGLAVFFWLIFLIFKNTLKIYRENEDDYIEGLSLGFLASLTALLIIGIGANVFIIVRVMEPFWFIAAMVITAPQIKAEVA